jgi:hypothetical protein
MGCLPSGRAGVEPQDQPGNCSGYGTKLIELKKNIKTTRIMINTQAIRQKIFSKNFGSL